MSTVVKIALWAAGIGAAVYAVREFSNQWSDKISVAFKSFGLPAIKGSNITLPVTLQVTNKTPLSLPINNIQAALFILRNGMWDLIGQTENTGPVNIISGITPITFYPIVDLAKLTPKVNVLSVLNVLANNTPLTTVRIIAKINVQGYELVQTVEQQISIDQLLHAA